MLQNLRNKLKDNKGFSLVELIVVIAIMVILVALLVPKIANLIPQANEMSGQNGANAIFTAAQNYLGQAAANNVDISTIATLDESSNFTDKDGNTVNFSDSLPTLPKKAHFDITVEKGNVKQVVYKPDGTGEGYKSPEDAEE